jgi:hypothetical protein
MTRARWTMLAPLLLAGCITDKPFNPAATRPATDVDPKTAQVWYYLDQPGVVMVADADYDALWNACCETAQSYLFVLDRQDYRRGLLTTKSMISMQIFEPWRRDAGSMDQVVRSTLASTRRTVRFEFSRGADGAFTVTPKVLVEQECIVEHRITLAAQYYEVFSAPLADSALSAHNDYWLPISRDNDLERELADSIRRRLEK